ncbi:MAG: multidrug transporter ATP-binding protein [Thermoleophilia bacterium]|nr:multidrug transporter ATP-binding protein [Thermoleophilia bacterium]
MAPATSTLRARGISRAFAARPVLRAVDLERMAPGVIGLVGPNGAGKTTLLRILAQLVEADAGTLEIAGITVEHGDAPTARRLVGYAPHAVLAWLDDSVERNLRYAARLAGLDRRAALALVDDTIDQWELGAERSSPVRRLSRGWQQRYALARAELLDPAVVLLDEPTTGLDDAARDLLERSIARWRSERIVVIASHEREWLAARSDQQLELQGGAA